MRTSSTGLTLQISDKFHCFHGHVTALFCPTNPFYNNQNVRLWTRLIRWIVKQQPLSSCSHSARAMCLLRRQLRNTSLVSQ